MLGLGGAQTQQVGQQLGVAPSQMSSALEAAVPLLLGKLTQNATNPEQAQALSAAIEQHDGSALDMFQSGQMPNISEGQNILGHVFGGQQDSAAYAVAQRAGISPQTAMQILAMVAPLVMAYLGRNRNADTSGMGGGLGSILGGNLGGLGSILGGVLGGGGLGSVLGSVLGGGQSQYQQPQYQQPQYQQPQQDGGGLGGMLGGVLGSVLGGGMGQAEAQSQYQQPQYQQSQYQDSGDLSGGVGLEPVGQQSQPEQTQQGGMFGAVNDVLGGNHGALDDLIGMFGGGQR